MLKKITAFLIATIMLVTCSGKIERDCFADNCTPCSKSGTIDVSEFLIGLMSVGMFAFLAGIYCAKGCRSGVALPALAPGGAARSTGALPAAAAAPERRINNKWKSRGIKFASFAALVAFLVSVHIISPNGEYIDEAGREAGKFTKKTVEVLTTNFKNIEIFIRSFCEGYSPSPPAKSCLVGNFWCAEKK